jgi:hypothetical protein
LVVERLEDRTLLSISTPGTEGVRAAYGQLPLAFEANQGQAPALINFVARGAGYMLCLMPTEAELRLHKPTGTPVAQVPASPGNAVQLQLIGANPAARATGLDELITKTNYYLGSDPSRWRSNVPNFGKVEYQDVYPGIDLVYYGNQGQLEYDFVVAPEADPGAITLTLRGTQGLTLDGQGNLVLHTSGGDVLEHAPVLYQEMDDVRQAVSGRFVLEGKDQVGFQVGAYDRSRPLVIDPVLSYSTYLGGSVNDWGQAVAVDGSGDAYVTGFTQSSDFPTANAIRTTLPGTFAAFVSKLNAAGTALVYSTYLGGGLTPSQTSAMTQGFGIAVDSAGNAYVSGSTSAGSNSTNPPDNFPTTPGAFQMSYGSGSQKAFVAKFSATGGLVYSTYLGGSGADGPTLNYLAAGNVIAVDGAGNAYVAGPTTSTDFPTKSAAYPTWNSSWGSAGYVTEINAAGSGLVYSTYLPGGPGNAVALKAGQVYVTGDASTSFPTTSNAFQRSGGGSFVAVLSPALAPAAQLLYATYLNHADAHSIAVDGSGNVYVSGSVVDKYFPTTTGAFQTNFAGGMDAFVAKINPALSGSASLVYSTYLGGTHQDQGWGIAVDSAGNAYVTGVTYFGYSNKDKRPVNNFPVTANALQGSGYAFRLAFVTVLNATASALLFSTYLGASLPLGDTGRNQSFGTGMALDGTGNIYVTGHAGTNFPTTDGAFQTTLRGDNAYNAFVAKISPVAAGGTGSPPPAIPGSVPANAGGGGITFEQVESPLRAAILRWAAAGVNAPGLSGVEVRIADLPDGLLSRESGHTIGLDDNAAGWGRFIDPRPWDDSEFITPGNQRALGRMSRLTAVMHEMGHMPGYEHESEVFMAETLEAGTRLTSVG